MSNLEKIFTMANGQEATYRFGKIPSQWNTYKKIECDTCEYCAPNISKNDFVSDFQEKDVGLCFKDYPKVALITKNLSKEISCRRIGK